MVQNQNPPKYILEVMEYFDVESTFIKNKLVF